MQEAARQAARTNSIQTQLTVARASDGTALLWKGADPVADSTGSLTVTQREQQAYLEWAKFNLGVNDTLTFDQKTYGGASASQWIAFNFVRDAEAKPSQIFGSIKADGQVYILNANGILFGGTAKVDTHALVASSLPINPTLLQRGLLVQEDGDAGVQFLFSAVSTNSGFNAATPTDLTPNQTARYIDSKTGKAVDGGTVYGKIEVQEGARLTAVDDEANHIGGRVALIAPSILNQGMITANDGQVILAAGLQVGLAAHRSDDPTLRGLDAFVGLVDNTDETSGTQNAGLVLNDGLIQNGALTHAGIIQAKRGSIFITGKDIGQYGVLDSTTSVSYNGRIDLVAAYNAIPNAGFSTTSELGTRFMQFYYQSNTGNSLTDPELANSGSIVLGSGSVTRILPEVASSERLTGDLSLSSLVNLQGRSILVADRATLVAPGAALPLSGKAYGADGLALSAGVTLQAGRWANTAATTSAGPILNFVHTADEQQIYLGSGAIIDAAGLTSNDIRALGGVLPSVEEFIVSVELRGNELAGSPLQRSGALRGETIKVDLRQHGAWNAALNDGKGGYEWVGTPLADTSGWVGLASHSIGELTLNGGSVSLQAGGAVVLQENSTIDVKGGSIDYQGGYTQTTKLLQQGHLVDIAKADAGQVYDGIFSDTTVVTDAKWGVKKTFVNGVTPRAYEVGFSQGGNGGSLAITAPVLALDGSLEGATSAGQYQRTLAPTYDPTTGLVTRTTGVPNWLLNSLSLPIASQLAITVKRQEFYTDGSLSTYLDRSPTPASILFTDGKPGYADLALITPALAVVNGTVQNYVDLTFAKKRGYEIDLGSALVRDFGILSVDNSGDNTIFSSEILTSQKITRGSAAGNITIAGDTPFIFSPGGYLNLAAANINVQAGASLVVPGGTIKLQAYDVSSSAFSVLSALSSTGKTVYLPDYDASRGNITVATNATLSTAGIVSDLRQGSALVPQVLSGGNISLGANFIDLQSRSLLDVSGGAALSSSGKVTYASAGEISLGTTSAVGGEAVTKAVPMGGGLRLDGELHGYAGVGKSGGSLKLVVPALSVSGPGENSLVPDGLTKTVDDGGRLLLTTGFFDQGGFSKFDFTGLGLKVLSDHSIDRVLVPTYAVYVGENAVIAPHVANWSSIPQEGVTTDTNVHLRTPSVLKFSAKGLLYDLDGTTPLVNSKGIVLAKGSVLETDNGDGMGGTIALSTGSTGFLDIYGSLIAHGGTISLKTEVGQGGKPSPTLHLASSSTLDVSGRTTWGFDATQPVRADDPNHGFVKTGVADGGTVEIDGNIVADAGAKISAAGAQDAIQLSAVTSLNSTRALPESTLVSTVKESNGGTIKLIGEQLLVTKATLDGRAGGSTGLGGSLLVSSNISAKTSITNPVNANDPVLVLTTATPNFNFYQNAFWGELINADTGLPFAGVGVTGQLAVFGTDTLTSQSGFADMTFSTAGGGALQVQGDVKLTAGKSISIADRSVLSFASNKASSLTIGAQYVKLGSDFLLPATAAGADANYAPTAGAGKLVVNAGTLIDVGNLSVQGAGTVQLNAVSGSVRGDGTLDVAGDLSITARQIYPPSAVTFNLIANDWTDASGVHTGSITINPGDGSAATPLSAGGSLGLYASRITQNGVLRAPLGKIILGAASSTAMEDPLVSTTTSKKYVPITTTLILSKDSLTSVSADGLAIPYGINVNGDSWIDPTGTDITASGPLATAKTIKLTATNIDLQNGSSLDLSGGGELTAYRFVTGTGGKKDILGDATTGAFAIVPNFGDSFAPYAPYNEAALSTTLGQDRGFVSGYAIGQKIHLAGGDGLPAGDYTVLPARYALLSGAYLITPKNSTATAGAAQSLAMPDGSSLVSGYFFNGLSATNRSQTVYKTFEVASQDVVLKRAQYDMSNGSEFFADVAQKNSTTAPRSAIDAGQLVLMAQSQLNLQGNVRAAYSASAGGRASIVDITTLSDIQIGGKIDTTSGLSTLLLDPSQLSGLGSVLIGGQRTTGADVTSVAVNSGKVTVADGTSITGFDDLTLVSNDALVLGKGAVLRSAQNDNYSAEAFVVDGNGALVRVSSDTAAAFTRKNGTTGTLTVGSADGSAVTLTGGSVILDSAANSSIASNVVLGDASSWVTLSSGNISVQSASTAASSTGLVLQGDLLKNLNNVAAASLRSYHSIDFLDGVTLGSASLGKLGLHAASLHGAGSGTAVTIAAKDVLLDNAKSATAGVSGGSNNTLNVKSETLHLGSGSLTTDGFSNVVLDSSRELSIEGAGSSPGSLTVNGGSLSVQTPVVVGAATANQTIAAANALTLANYQGALSTVKPDDSGLAAKLTLTGGSVDIGADLKLPGGALTVTASGNLTVTSALNVGGTSKSFFDVSQSVDGGTISLTSTAGDVNISGATLNVGRYADDSSWTGNAGTLKISASTGRLITDAASTHLLGLGGEGGLGGNFILDVSRLAASGDSRLASLHSVLNAGGFDRSIGIRVRQGNVVVDGDIKAHDYALSADGGSIAVKQGVTINASGFSDANNSTAALDPTGGTISLAAAKSVFIESGAVLNAAGYCYDNAGKGGSIYLAAGGYTNDGTIGSVDASAVVSVNSEAVIDLGVKKNFTTEDLVLASGSLPTSSSLASLAGGGTLLLRESQAALMQNPKQFDGLAINPADRKGINGASSIVVDGFMAYDLSEKGGTNSSTIQYIPTSGLIDSQVENTIKANGSSFVSAMAAANSAFASNALVHVRPEAEIVNSGTATRQLVTIYKAGTLSVSVPLGTTTVPKTATVSIPGGLPLTDKITVNLSGSGTTPVTATFDDGTQATFSTASFVITPKSSGAKLVSLDFVNKGAARTMSLVSAANSTAIPYAPFTVSMDTAVSVTNLTNNSSVVKTLTAAGDLALANTWNLGSSAYRFGANSEPGLLTLRAKNNLTFTFDASLSDGFDTDPTYGLWMGTLQKGSSWSYRLVGGADYAAADTRQVRPVGNFGADAGSVLIGRGSPDVSSATTNVTRAGAVLPYYQTIRTGTGYIDITAGRDVLLLNPLATVYTAGQRAEVDTKIFDLPILDLDKGQGSSPYYGALYGYNGGNLHIAAQNDLARYRQTFDTTGKLTGSLAYSVKQMPTNWLYRRGLVGSDGRFATVADLYLADGNTPYGEIQSTSWWIDYSNFFSDLGALGGGNVTLTAGQNVQNVNAAVPTNARMPGRDASGQAVAPDAKALIELGGGNLNVSAGANLDGGVYYVERGGLALAAGGEITTNKTRYASSNNGTSDKIITWLPTTLFLGKGQVDVVAGGDARVGPVANPFWLPQGINNRQYELSYFTTFDQTDSVSIVSLGGAVTLQAQPNAASLSQLPSAGSLMSWYAYNLGNVGNTSAPQRSQPWLRLATDSSLVGTFSNFSLLAGILPGSLSVTTFSDDINIVGQLNLAPAQKGSFELYAGRQLNGLADTGSSTLGWNSSMVNLSDASPANLPGITNPISATTFLPIATKDTLSPVTSLFAEAGAMNFLLGKKLSLHGQVDGNPLHANDTEPVRLYAADGDVSGLTLFSGKSARIMASNDITDIALYVQNVHADDLTLVAAGRDIIAYDPSSTLRVASGVANVAGVKSNPGGVAVAGSLPNAGDIQVAGPGTLEVLAGRDLVLGTGSNKQKDGTAIGITTVGAERNPYLAKIVDSDGGAAIVAAAGIRKTTTAEVPFLPGLANAALDYAAFTKEFIDPATAIDARYVAVLGELMGTSSSDPAAIWNQFQGLSEKSLADKEAKDRLLLGVFSRILRDAGRDHNDKDSLYAGTYELGLSAIKALFPGSLLPGSGAGAVSAWQGNISLPTKLIKTFEGGDISLLVPGGLVSVGRNTDKNSPDQGVLTQRGGAISIFSSGNVDVGTSRIFTLRGGNEVIWSTLGNIAAGSGAKTIAAAPPTRVLVDPQSADVQNDLAGLATGSGIGVLATLAGVAPGDVDLIAPGGTIDAGDAGIRSSGRVSVSAAVIVNAANIQSSAGTSGAPVVASAAPPPAVANNTASATKASSDEVAKKSQREAARAAAEVLPSIIQVEVLGYGGGEGDELAKNNEVQPRG